MNLLRFDPEGSDLAQPRSVCPVVRLRLDASLPDAPPGPGQPSILYEVQGKLSVPLDDIKRFRQIDSRRAGHPEYR